MIAIVLLLSLLATAANAISASELVGTWTTKSRSVVTGPVGTSNKRYLDEMLTMA